MKSIRITDGGWVGSGSFSPDGSKVAYVKLTKHFNSDGRYYFGAEVRIWDGKTSHTVTKLPDGKAGTDRVSIPSYGVYWLSGDDYLLATGWMLIRISDGKYTKVGKSKTWFVMNDDWKIPKADAIRLNDIVHGRNIVWLAKNQRTPTWESLHRGWKLGPLGKAPKESKDWYYNYCRSPKDPNKAFYIAEDKHFDGCCCTQGEQKTYLGIADLRTGKMRRLTWGDMHISFDARCTPDGRYILYKPASLPRKKSGPHGVLHIMRSDGSGDRGLIRNVVRYDFLSPSKLLAITTDSHVFRRTEDYFVPYPEQLTMADFPSGRARQITKGSFVHQLCDTHGSKYLVAERPLGEKNYLQGNLYILE